MQILPLTPSPNQTFQAVLSIDGANRTLQFFIRWNDMAEYWTMKITDPITSMVLLDSIPMVTGDDPVANLLEQYSYLKIGSAYLINLGSSSANSSDTDLGSKFILVWGDTPNG